jgi:YVTN family beta-propeller protein
MKSHFILTVLLVSVVINATGCEKEDMILEMSDNITYEVVYVVNGGSNSISVINAETNAVDKTISLPSNVSWPHHINLSPDGRILVVGVPGMDLSGGHEVAHVGHGGATMKGGLILLDAISGKVKVSREIEAMNHNGIFSPDGKEIWTALMMDSDSGMNKVQIFNATLSSLIKEIAVDNQPAEVTFSNDGKYAFVANGGSGTVTVIEVSTKNVKAKISVGATPVGAWPGVDGRMYVDNERSKTVSVIDPSSLSVVQTIRIGYTPGYVATPASVDEFWVSDPDGAKVHYYKRKDGSHLGAFSVGQGAHAIVFNSSGTRGYVTNQTDGTVSVVDVSTHTATKTITVGSKPNGLLWRMKTI